MTLTRASTQSNVVAAAASALGWQTCSPGGELNTGHQDMTPKCHRRIFSTCSLGQVVVASVDQEVRRQVDMRALYVTYWILHHSELFFRARGLPDLQCRWHGRRTTSTQTASAAARTARPSTNPISKALAHNPGSGSSRPLFLLLATLLFPGHFLICQLPATAIPISPFLPILPGATDLDTQHTVLRPT